MRLLRLLLLCLSPLLLAAQIQVTASPIAKSAASLILSKPVSKIATIWTVTLENQGDQAISISESAVLRHIPEFQPLDHQTMSILIERAAQSSGWSRAGRISGDVGRLAAFLAAGKTLKLGAPALTAITGAVALTPYIVSRFQGEAIPVRQNYEALAWIAPLTLQPGESATRRIFSSKSSPKPVTFTIETGRAPAVRSLQ